MVRHLLKISDFSKTEIEKIINKAIEIKKNPLGFASALKGETLFSIL